MTRGRTRPARDGGFDLITIVMTANAGSQPGVGYGPEHLAILRHCRSPLSVAEISAHLRLPLVVIRVLLGDLLAQGLVIVRQPEPVSKLPSANVLKEVIHGLQAL